MAAQVVKGVELPCCGVCGPGVAEGGQVPQSAANALGLHRECHQRKGECFWVSRSTHVEELGETDEQQKHERATKDEPFCAKDPLPSPNHPVS